MKIQERQKIEISDCSVEYLLKLLSKRGISLSEAKIEKKLEHEYNSYGDDFSTAYVYLTFMEQFDGKKFAAIINGKERIEPWEFFKLFKLGQRISDLVERQLAEKLEVEPFQVLDWLRGVSFPRPNSKAILTKLSEVILEIEG